MSIALNLELQEVVKRHAAKRGLKTSNIFQELIEKYLVPNKNVHTIILKIPTDLRNKPEELKGWLDARCAVIMKSLTEQVSEQVSDPQE